MFFDNNYAGMNGTGEKVNNPCNYRNNFMYKKLFMQSTGAAINFYGPIYGNCKDDENDFCNNI
jgi:hypothetical protein